MRTTRFPHTRSTVRRAALVAAGAVGVSIALAGPAGAGVVHDEDNVQTRTVTLNEATPTVAHLEARQNADHQAAYVWVVEGPRTVQARAMCSRRNGGTQWYQSTIGVAAGGGSSHYDCDNNGTYNFELVGLGVDFLT